MRSVTFRGFIAPQGIGSCRGRRIERRRRRAHRRTPLDSRRPWPARADRGPRATSEEGSVTRFRTSTESAREVAADLLMVPAFTDGEPGPGLKDVGLADAYAAARLSGKKGEDLLVTRRDGDRFAAGNVLIVGAGAKGDFDVTAMRRILGRAAASTRRFPTVATT